MCYLCRAVSLVSSYWICPPPGFGNQKISSDMALGVTSDLGGKRWLVERQTTE